MVFPELTGIAIDGQAIAGFSADTLHYESVLPYGATDIPVVSAEATVANAISIEQADSLPGTATVSFDYDGIEKEYTVYFGFAPQSDSLTNNWLNPTWSIQNRNDDAMSVGFDGLSIDTENGDVWQTTNSARNIVSQPAAGNWTATVKVQFPTLPDTAYQQGGLIVYDDLDNLLKLDLEYNGRRMLQLAREEDAVFTAVQQSPASGNFALGADNEMFLKVVRNGDRYDFSYSLNGPDVTASSGTQTLALRQPKIALLALSNSDTAAEIPVIFSEFNVDMQSDVPAPVFEFRSYEKDGQVVAEYFNENAEEVSGNFILAVYDNRGRLVDTFVETLNADSNSLDGVVFDVDSSALEGKTVKVFAWDNAYVPLAGAINVSAAN
jgi:regulation of enolase protein 1 (concanavalin A-like superfamily)